MHVTQLYCARKNYLLERIEKVYILVVKGELTPFPQE